MVLGYFELPEDEVPDDSIWHHHARLEEWFAAVKQRRENPSSTRDESSDDHAGWARNELTDEILGGKS